MKIYRQKRGRNPFGSITQITTIVISFWCPLKFCTQGECLSCLTLLPARREPSLPALCPVTHLNPLGVLKEVSADGHQGVLWPLMEPVDGCAVDHGREFSCSYTQDGAHGGETQDYLEVDTVAAGWGTAVLGPNRTAFAESPFRRKSSLRGVHLQVRGWGEHAQVWAGSVAIASRCEGAGEPRALLGWPHKGGRRAGCRRE